MLPFPNAKFPYMYKPTLTQPSVELFAKKIQFSIIHYTLPQNNTILFVQLKSKLKADITLLHKRTEMSGSAETFAQFTDLHILRVCSKGTGFVIYFWGLSLFPIKYVAWEIDKLSIITQIRQTFPRSVIFSLLSQQKSVGLSEENFSGPEMPECHDGIPGGQLHNRGPCALCSPSSYALPNTRIRALKIFMIKSHVKAPSND